jgi:hypothetical protein
MQNHTSRLQGAQLELFRPLSNAIQWHKLPREIQTESGDVACEAASRILGNPASSRQGEGEQL